MNIGTLQNYALSETFSDISYRSGVDKSFIPGHKIIQSSASDYIQTLLKKTPKMSKINLPNPIFPITQEMKSDPTSKLISFSYKKPTLQALLDGGFGRDNCLSYYSIANSLKMTKAEKIILDYINENLMNKDNAAQFYLEASKFGNEEWRVKALDLIAQNFDEIIKNNKDYEKILDLPFGSFKSLIAREDLYIEKEDPLFKMVIRYINEREECQMNPRDMKAAQLLKMALKKAAGEDGEDKDDEEKDKNKVEEEKKDQKGEEEGDGKEIPANQEEDFEKEARVRIQRFKLNQDEIKELLLLLRYKFISHEEILKASKEEILQPFRDILMEGISAKLKTFEDVSNNYSIIMEPRQHYMNARMLSSAQFQEKTKNEKIQKYAHMFKNHIDEDNNFPEKTNKGFLRDNKGKKRLKRASKNLLSGRNKKINNDFDPNKLAGDSTFKNAISSKFQNSNFFNFDQSQNPNPKNASTFPNFKNEFQNESPLSPSNFHNLNAKSRHRHNNMINVDSDPDNIDDEDDEIEFRYNYDFDENGALHYLGTKGNSQNYVNPYTLSQVKVYFSSMGRGSYEDFVGRSLVNCRTLNEPNAFMGIDFGPERYLIPSCYTIRNRDSTRHVLLNWIFEGSRDFRTWFILDKRIHKTQDPHYNSSMERERAMLEKRGASTTWSIDQNYLKMAARSISLHSTDFNGFRFFRIKQISKNSSGSDNLALSGFEIYGIGKGRGWFFEQYE